MLILNKVFSSGALFLHSSPLDLRGECQKNANVYAQISKNGEIFSSAEAKASDDGAFCVTLTTPAASFEEYVITVKSEGEEIVLSDILFGELWLAAGQSNMQLPNRVQPEWENSLKLLLEKNVIRAYESEKLSLSSDYPIDPISNSGGTWRDSKSPDSFATVSALASAFSVKLFEYFSERGVEMPIGFINSNYGATSIVAWLPDSAFENHPKIAYKRQNRETWNTVGETNFQQTSAQYNKMIHSLLGVKIRGILWYQGENDVCREQTEHIYSDLLLVYRETYKELFAADEDEKFPVVCSLLYPWPYVPSTPECNAGYMNRNFVETARKYPDDFLFVSLSDLKPIWGYHSSSGPIHPVHKYTLGYRFAQLVFNAYYEDSDKQLQRKPASLKSVVKKGNVLRLTFSDVGSGIFVKGKRVKGLYVRSKNSVYVNAEIKIVSENEIDVWNSYIEDPEFVAYAVSSGEIITNLFAGDFPVAPFCTEFTDENGAVDIGVKPWLSTDLDSDFVYEEPMGLAYPRSFSCPIFYACENSEICFDSVFERSGRSLNVWGRNKTFGAYVVARRYSPLDLYNYSSLKMSIYNAQALDSFINVYYKEEDESVKIVRIDATVEEALSFGWNKVAFDLGSLSRGKIERLDFAFTVNTDKKPNVSFANIDEIELVPKT